jgi:hypothetical protein
MVRAAFGEALVPVMAPTVSVMMGVPPPSNELAREAPVRWHNGGDLVGNGSKVSGPILMGYGTIYLGSNTKS